MRKGRLFSIFSTKLIQFSSISAPIWRNFNTIMASNNKSPRVGKRIGTHSGVFHCDEALACYMLKQLPEYSHADIIRTREPEVLDQCDIVVDVGNVYDASKNRFDHHQRGFNETLSSVRPDLSTKFDNIKLSSAGLVYAHFGLDVISELLKKHNITAGEGSLKTIYTHIYEGFVEELDAIDNGIPMYGEGKPRYKINTHLSARVHRINPAWNDEGPHDLDLLFKKAMNVVGQEFEERVIESVNVWWPARALVEKAIKSRKQVHPSGQIIVFNERCSWKDHLYAVEEDLGIQGEIKFCIFNDRVDSWRVQGIPVQPDSFICRVFLHEAWRGVRDEELSSTAGIKGCIFCHAAGFIGGNKTMEGVLEMAVKSLEAAGKNDTSK